ncbi:MAG: Polymorphic membrane protein, partial [uncultured bacterium]
MSHKTRLFVFVFFAICASTLFLATTALAATFTVNAFYDAVDASPGDGVCADAIGACTLRAAADESNATTGSDIIIFANPGTYNIGLSGPMSGTGVQLTRPVTINGGSLGRIILQGTSNSEMFASFGLYATVLFENLVMQGANRAIENSSGILTVNQCLLQNNTATTGGAIYTTYGTVSISNSSLTNNSATSDGGAIYAGTGGTVSIINSQISNNSGRTGGAIKVYPGANLSIADSVLNNNTASSAGGAIHYYSGYTTTKLTILRSDLSYNVAAASGGALYVAHAPYISIHDSSITNNVANGVLYGGGGGGLGISSAITPLW